MKTPDKIYIPNDIKVTAAALLTNGIQESDVEYIRKDALLELIKEESKFWDDGEMIFRGLIDKLNSM